MSHPRALVCALALLLLTPTTAFASDGSGDLLAANQRAERLIDSCRARPASCRAPDARANLGMAFLAVATWRAVVTGEPASEELATARYLAPDALVDWEEVLPPSVEAYPIPWVYALDAEESEPAPASSARGPTPEPAATRATASPVAPSAPRGTALLVGGAMVVRNVAAYDTNAQPSARAPSPNWALRGRVRGRPVGALSLEVGASYTEESRLFPQFLDGARLSGFVLRGHGGAGAGVTVLDRLALDAFVGLTLQTGSLTPASVAKGESLGVVASPGHWGLGPTLGGRLTVSAPQRRVSFVAGSTVALVGRAMLVRGPVVGTDAADMLGAGRWLDDGKGDALEIDGDLAVLVRLAGPVSLRLGVEALLQISQGVSLDPTTGDPSAPRWASVHTVARARPHVGLQVAVP